MAVRCYCYLPGLVGSHLVHQEATTDWNLRRYVCRHLLHILSFVLSRVAIGDCVWTCFLHDLQ